MKKQFLECGKIVSTHGIHGELKVQPWCDGAEFLCDFATVYLAKGEKPLAVEGARVVKNMTLLKLRGIDSIDDAVTLRGKILYIDRGDVPPADDGSFFVQDLIGLAVLDADTGKTWGELTDVFSTGANDVYEVTNADGRKLLLPAIKDVVIETDPDAGFMRIRPLEGLFDED